MADDPEVDLAEVFGEIARALLAEDDAEATLARIVRLAVETIDGCEHAGISMIEGKLVTSPASSDEIPAIVDRIQSETGEGPCVDAIREHEVFQTGHLSQEDRWPDFARRASAESGIESILSFRLFAENDTMGSLNLYSTQTDAFDDHDVAIRAVFATHAAVAWSTSRKVENLEAGMDSRQLIGTAIGILMNRQNVSEAEAFDILRRGSQRLNIKLRVIAEQVVHRPASSPPAANATKRRPPGRLGASGHSSPASGDGAASRS
jgi:GAF domain-containing protein